MAVQSVQAVTGAKIAAEYAQGGRSGARPESKKAVNRQDSRTGRLAEATSPVCLGRSELFKGK